MDTITIDFNETINPCILTPDGEFANSHHSFYVTCDSSNKIYKKHGWYLGTVLIGSNNLTNVKRETLSKIIKNIQSTTDSKINYTNKTEVKQLLENKFNDIIIKMNKLLPQEITPVNFSNYTIDTDALNEILNKIV